MTNVYFHILHNQILIDHLKPFKMSTSKNAYWFRTHMVIPFEQCWQQAVLPFKSIQMVLNGGYTTPLLGVFHIAEWFQGVNVLFCTLLFFVQSSLIFGFYPQVLHTQSWNKLFKNKTYSVYENILRKMQIKWTIHHLGTLWCYNTWWLVYK